MPDTIQRIEHASLGEILLGLGKLAAPNLERALRLQAENREALDKILTTLGLITEGDLASALAQGLNLPLIRAKDFPLEPLHDGRLTRRFLRQSRVIPLQDDADGLLLAMAIRSTISRRRRPVGPDLRHKGPQ